MTSNNGAVGLKAVIADFRKDFDNYLHFRLGNIGLENSASIIEAFTGARILDMCIQRGEIELQNEEDARCKALQNIGEIICDKWNEITEELDKTTALADRNTLIGQIQAYALMLNVVNTMLPLALQVSAAKPVQEAGNAD